MGRYRGRKRQDWVGKKADNIHRNISSVSPRCTQQRGRGSSRRRLDKNSVSQRRSKEKRGYKIAVPLGERYDGGPGSHSVGRRSAEPSLL